jgi:hypothetical protein
LFLTFPQINARPVTAINVLGTGMLGRTVGDQRRKLGNVKGRHFDGHGQIHGDTAGHTDLLNPEIGIGRDHDTSTEIHALAD